MEAFSAAMWEGSSTSTRGTVSQWRDTFIVFDDPVHGAPQGARIEP